MTPTAPTDDHEGLLVHHTHPTDWQNPEPGGRYNLVILGAGTAGLVCAAGAAGLGARVALIEKHRLGGDCLNYGCVPAKALLPCARAAAAVPGAARYAVPPAGPPAGAISRARRRAPRLPAARSEK